MSEKRPLVISNDGKIQELADGDTLYNFPSLPLVATTDIVAEINRVTFLPFDFDLGLFELCIEGDVCII